MFNIFLHAEEMVSVSNEIYVKEEASCSSLECDQVCSVLFVALLFIIKSEGSERSSY